MTVLGANTQFLFSNTLTQHYLFHRNSCTECNCYCNPQDAYSLWVAPFGNYVHQDARQAIPTYTNKIAGALLGFDYYCAPGMVFGAGLAYAFNKVQYSRKFGHSIINQESAVLYSSFDNSLFYVNAALWGGLYQTSNTRKSFTFITSKSNPHGWNLTPHLELGKSFPLTSHCYLMNHL